MSNKPNKFLGGKSLTMPLAAFSMACILFVYTRTSIRAAKANAQKHREADGGQISWRNENLRRHGVVEGPGEDKGVVRELAGTLVGGESTGVGKSGGGGGKGEIGEEERRVREMVRSQGRG